LEECADIGYENQDIGLYDAIMQLNQKHRLAVTLHYVEGFSVAEVAKILKIPQGTVKSRLSKARAILKTQLSTETATETEKEKEGDSYEKRCIPKST
jgi:RNA polymerase sigma-70 factor (ECF subfamily)